MKSWNFGSPHPLRPGRCPSQGLAAVSALPPVAVNPLPWHTAADLDEEVGCSFQCPLEACPLDLFFLFTVKSSCQCWFKSQHFCLFGIFAYSFLAFFSSLAAAEIAVHGGTYSVSGENQRPPPLARTPPPNSLHKHTSCKIFAYLFFSIPDCFCYVHLIFTEFS